MSRYWQEIDAASADARPNYHSKLDAIQFLSPRITHSCVPLIPLRRLRPAFLRLQTWRQSILVSKNHALLRSVDARSGGCSSRSGSRAPLRRLRPVLGADRSVISKLELCVVACGGPGVGHRPNVYTAMCAPKRARATADQAKKHRYRRT